MEFESNKKFETFCRKVVGGIRHYFDKQRSGELVIEKERERERETSIILDFISVSGILPRH